jgi:hypothetical protein
LEKEFHWQPFQENVLPVKSLVFGTGYTSNLEVSSYKVTRLKECYSEEELLVGLLIKILMVLSFVYNRYYYRLLIIRKSNITLR